MEGGDGAEVGVLDGVNESYTGKGKDEVCWKGHDQCKCH